MEKTIKRQVFPQAPSPTITSFLRMSAMMQGEEFGLFRRDEDAVVVVGGGGEIGRAHV